MNCRAIVPLVLSLLAAPALVLGQATLRLSTTTVGPITFATGGVPASQTLEAFNAGSGNLNLTLASSVPWMNASVGAARNCTTRTGQCLPITITFQSGTLARGIYTGILTVRDPNAIDAPQTVTVTIQAGGGVPDNATFFVAPGRTTELPFSTNSAIDGRNAPAWLSLALEGGGTFRFIYNYRLVANAGNLAAGNYSGSIVTSGSTFGPDNKTIPVTLNVTNNPIAAPAPNTLRFRIPQGGGRFSQFISVNNRGIGNLAVSAVTPATTSGGTWLAGATQPNNAALVRVEADAGTLAQGTYAGTVTLASNAANGNQVIPVTLEVIAAGAPFASVGNVLNIGTYGRSEPLAPGGATAVFGEQFVAAGTQPASPSALPLPTELGGVRVFVNDVAAPLYYTSYDQVNFQIPFETTPGLARVRVDRGAQRGNTVSVDVQARAPRIMTYFGDYGIVVNGNDGTLVLPRSFNVPNGKPARAGEVLVIYAIGLGATSPTVASGVGSPATEPLARLDPVPSVTFGRRGPFNQVSATPFFAGLAPGFVGLYQINVIVPENVPVGDDIPIALDLEGVGSNAARIAIQ